MHDFASNSSSFHFNPKANKLNIRGLTLSNEDRGLQKMLDLKQNEFYLILATHL